MKARKIPKENRLPHEQLLDVFYDVDFPASKAIEEAQKALTETVEEAREILNDTLDEIKEQADSLIETVREETFCFAYQLGYSDGLDATPDADEQEEEQETEDEEGWI